MRANSAKSREQLMCLAWLTLCYALSFMDRLCTGTRDNVYEETQARGVSKGRYMGVVLHQHGGPVIFFSNM